MGQFIRADDHKRGSLYDNTLLAVVQDIRNAGESDRIDGCVIPKTKTRVANGGSVFDNGMIETFMNASEGQSLKKVMRGYVDRICPPGSTAEGSPAPGSGS